MVVHLQVHYQTWEYSKFFLKISLKLFLKIYLKLFLKNIWKCKTKFKNVLKGVRPYLTSFPIFWLQFLTFSNFLKRPNVRAQLVGPLFTTCVPATIISLLNLNIRKLNWFSQFSKLNWEKPTKYDFISLLNRHIGREKIFLIFMKHPIPSDLNF